MQVSRAITLGQLVVNGPVFLLLFVPPYLAFITAPENYGLMVLVTLLSFGAAWGYWALAVPRWRVWALQHVEDAQALEVAAVLSGLTWPEGHLLGRTEITTKKLRAKREALKRHRSNP